MAVPHRLGVLVAAATVLLLAAPPGSAEADPAELTTQNAMEEFMRVVAVGESRGPALTLCHLGATEFMFELSRWLLLELAPPERSSYVLFFKVPQPARVMVAQLADAFPGRVHMPKSLEQFDSHCSVVLLPVSYPYFTVDDIRPLTYRQTALVGHFLASVDCHKNVHECRFFSTQWRSMIGDLEESCGNYFCVSAVPRERLQDPQLANMDAVCEALGDQETPPSVSSQWQQDWFVYRNFVRGTTMDTRVSEGQREESSRQGVFVDVGAFHPLHLSNTFFFERCLGWRGLCVEPNPGFAPHFGAYRSCELVRNCVWSKPRSVVMSFEKDPIEAYIQDDVEGGTGSGAVLISETGRSRPGMEFKAQCRTLEDILMSAGLQKPTTIDFMSVDAEAAEVEIFKNFSFDKFDISVVNVEVQAANYYELDVAFFAAGYAKVAVLGGDHVYAKLQRTPKLPEGAAAWHEMLARDFHAHGKPRTPTFGGSG